MTLALPFHGHSRHVAHPMLQHLLLLLLLLCTFVSVGGPVTELQVQRVLQFERTLGREKIAFGPQAVAFRGALAPVDVRALASRVAEVSLSVSSKIACLYGDDDWSTEFSSREARLRAMDAIAQILENDKLVGVVFTEEVFAASWSALKLTQRAFPFPIFVAPKQPGVTMLLEDVIPSAQGRFRGEVVLRSSDSRKGTPAARDWPKSGSLVLAKLEFLPRGAATEVDGRLSILVTSTFDVVGLTPSRSFADVSGAAAGVALVAPFVDVVALPPSEHSLKSLQFLFSNFGRLNYATTREWLAHQPKSFFSTTDLVVCLDTLLPQPHQQPAAAGVEDPPYTLYLHLVPGAEQLPSVAQFVEQLKRLAASQTNPVVEVSVVLRKINTTHHDLRFEHEVFAHKKLPALTISTVTEPPEDQLVRFYRSSSTGSESSASPQSERPLGTAEVKVAAALIRDALGAVAHITQRPSTAISAGELSDLMEMGLSTPNAASLFATRSPVQRAIEKSLKRLAKDSVTVKSTPLTIREIEVSSLVTLDPTTAIVEVYSGVDTLGELLLMGGIGVYVIVFAVVTLGVETAMSLITGRKDGPGTAKLTKVR